MKPIIITGHPKSGTTLLVSLFDGHPYINPVIHEELNLRERIKQTTRSEYLKEIESYRVSHILSDFWVEKTPSNYYIIPHLKKWFPNAFFVHITRDPEQNYLSFKKYMQWEHNIDVAPEIFWTEWRFSEYMAKKYGAYILSYDILVNLPERELKKMCRAGDIGFDPRMLDPTINRRPWLGNSIYGDKFAGISRRPTLRKQNRNSVFFFDEQAYKKSTPMLRKKILKYHLFGDLTIEYEKLQNKKT